jgi:hypothetical protein
MERGPSAPKKISGQTEMNFTQTAGGSVRTPMGKGMAWKNVPTPEI